MYRFYLKDKQGNYLSINENQLVFVKSPLPHAPDGWDGIGLQWTRNETNFGVFRKVAIDVRFVLEGAQILRSLYYSKGTINAFATLEIQILNSTTQEYELFESCEVDFSEFKDEDLYVTVNLKDIGLTSILEEKGSTDYSADILPNGARAIIRGLNIKGYIKWYINTTTSSTSFIAADMTLSYRSSSIGKEYVPDNVQNVGDLGVPNKADRDNQAKEAMKRYFLKGTHTSNVTLTLKNTRTYSTAEASTISSGSPRLCFLAAVRRSTDMSSVYQGKYRNYPLLFEQTYHQSLTNYTLDYRRYTDKSYVFDVRENETLALDLGFIGTTVSPSTGARSLSYGTFEVGMEQAQRIFSKDTDVSTNQPSLELEYELVMPTSRVYGLFYIDLLRQILDKMGATNVVIQSSILTNINLNEFDNFDTLPARALVCSGDSLRGYTDAKISTNFNELMEDLRNRFGVTYGVVGNTLIVEKFEYFFQNSSIVRLENISDVAITPYKLFGGKLQVGYQDMEVDDYTTKNDPNKRVMFEIKDLTKVALENNIIAPYQSGLFAIEAVRSGAINKASGDTAEERKSNAYDSDTFVIEVGKTGRINPSDSKLEYTSKSWEGKFLNGGFDPGRYTNLGYTPMRMLGRSLRLLRSFVNSGDMIQTIKGLDFDSDLQNATAVNAISEDGDLNLEGDFFAGRNVSPLFKPLVFEFQCSAPKGFMLSMNTNPYGYVEFYVRGTLIKGFILDAGVIPSSREVYNFRILSTTDTDYSKLIK